MSAQTRRALGFVVILSIVTPAPILGGGDRSTTRSARIDENTISLPSARLVLPPAGTDLESRIRMECREVATDVDESDDLTPLDLIAPPIGWSSSGFDESGASELSPRFSHRIDAAEVRLERLRC